MRWMTRCTFIFLMLPVILALPLGCQKSAPEKPQAPTPLPMDTVCAVYGMIESTRPEDKWTMDLRIHLTEDIRWELPKRAADKKNMTLIPYGQATLGCNLDDPYHEQCLPRQTLFIHSFFIDLYEVTNTEYNRCVAEKMCLPLATNPDMVAHTKPDHPAYLTYKQAERYCLWAGKRLPREYEWEKAARGTDQWLYPWGNQAPDSPITNICGAECVMAWADADWPDGYMYTSPVGRFEQDRSPYGLYDVAGNVKEWVQTHVKLPANQFIARGGSWYSASQEMRATYRQVWKVGIRLDDKGVRCALSQ